MPHTKTNIDYFTPIPDVNIPDKYRAIGAKYRQLAAEQGVPRTHPICCRVCAGFVLNTHAPLAGPCSRTFRYLQGCNFQDEATRDGYVFWVPGILRGSTLKSVSQQTRQLSDTRIRLELPAHHMSGFGSVTLVAGLMLAHFKATSERILHVATRTDTCDSDGDRFELFWYGRVLDYIIFYTDDQPYDFVGVLALGVEFEN